MAIDRRQGKKVQASARREDAVGTRVDPYPYIGIIKNNVDPCSLYDNASIFFEN